MLSSMNDPIHTGKTILAFDTALTGCNVALMTAEGDDYSEQVETQRDQAKLLVPMTQDILKRAELTYQDIDLIVVTNGPGSFTGLRLGLATARALALALDCPVIGINSFDFVRAHYQKNGIRDPLLVVLETKRQDFYVQAYDGSGQPQGDPVATSAANIAEYYDLLAYKIGGDCIERVVADVGLDNLSVLGNIMQPDPILLCYLTLSRPLPEAGERPEPLYLRGADVSLPKNLPRQLER